MPNSSGFIDFSQYAKQNAPEEQRLLEEAMARAEQSDAAARSALSKAGRDAGAKYGADGQLTGEVGLSQSASYSDYLKASKDASAAWAAVNARSKDPRRAALQDSMGGDAQARGTASAADLRSREDALGSSLDTRHQGLEGERGRRAADVATKQAAEAERAKTEQGWRDAYVESMYQGAGRRAAAGGTQRDFVGGYNPFANSTWARQQGGFEAQQIRNAGGSDDQARNIWDAYTAKGGAGAGLGPKDRYRPMYREMQPYAPDKEED